MASPDGLPGSPPPRDPEARRRRRRPETRNGRPTLTRERIADAALAVAGREGFPALTMRRLAAELGVTVRALYFYVQDRQEVVDLAARALLARSPDRHLDPADWRGSIRRLCHDGREHYRRHPRALLVTLDERLTPGGVDVKRITATEDLLAFLRAIGLTLPDALAIRAQFLIDLFGFALLVDHNYDRATPEQRRGMFAPVARPWLDAHPGVDAPNARRALELDLDSADEQFEHLVDHLIVAVEHRLAHPAPPAGGRTA